MVLKKTPLSSEEITLILNMKIEDAALLGELIIRADTSVNLDALANHALVDQLKDEHYAKIIRNTSKADVITRLIEKPIGDSSYLAIAENRASNADALVAVAKATKEVITTVSKHPNINASVYPVIARIGFKCRRLGRSSESHDRFSGYHHSFNASKHQCIRVSSDCANQAQCRRLGRSSEGYERGSGYHHSLKYQTINVSVSSDCSEPLYAFVGFNATGG